MERKTFLPIATAIGLLAVVGIVIAVSGDDDVSESPGAASVTVSGAWHPRTWALEDAREVEVRLGENGPSVDLGGATMVLTPTIDGLTLAWSNATSADDRLVFEGRGKFHDAQVSATWEFAQGNPQAFFSLHIEAVPTAAFDGDVVATLTMPAGDVLFANDGLRLEELGDDARAISGWTPGWLRWSGEGGPLQFSNWWADRIELTPEANGTRLEMTVFDRDAQPAVACEGSTVDVDLRFTASLEALIPFYPGRLEKGATAAAMPVFVPPDSHYHTAFQELRPTDPAEWAAQTRTLALGHSNTRDPRHGNGGMLGPQLGATFIVPARFADEEAVATLRKATAETAAELRVGGDDSAFAPPACDAREIWLREGSRSNGSYENPLTDGLGSGFDALGPTSLAVVTLDGTRTQLVDQALSRLYLERLGRERGLFPFATPLVATRNPLIQAASEALLVPERGGEWTIEPDLVRNFAELELWREEHPEVVVASVASVARKWGEMRACAYTIAENGFPTVTCDASVERLTLVIDGSHSPLVGERALPQNVRDADARAQTWTWLDVEGEAAIAITTAENRPRPLRWTLPKTN